MWQPSTDTKQGEGLKKLADYLAQTRRQAEASIDCLNNRIAELTQELEIAKEAAEQLQSERDYFRNYSEQLKLENSKKWRLQERDDWKSLVDSVQRDRSRLQDECHRLEIELEEKQAELTALQQQRQAPSSPAPSTSRFFFGSPIITLGSSADSPDDNFPSNPSQSPRAVAKELKLELAKAHAKLQVERASAEATAASQEAEIARLRAELEKSRRMKSQHASGTIWARGVGNSRNMSDGMQRNYHQSRSWSMSPLSLLDFFFSGGGKKEILAQGVLHV